MGAKSYVLKDTAARDLLEEIRTAHGGKHYFSSQIAEIAGKYSDSQAYVGNLRVEGAQV